MSGPKTPRPKARLLLLLGGMWHDFDGFAAAMRDLFGMEGDVEATYDLDALLDLERDKYAAVISYTCLTEHLEGHEFSGPEGMTDEQVDALCGWVRAGGGLLAAHAATVTGRSKPALGQLLGGVFVSHPERFAVTVHPLNRKHPITEGIEAFTVHDECYISAYVPGLDIHMAALDRGVLYPLVWSKEEGRGRVVFVAPGHDESVWTAAPYRRLMLQAMRWIMTRVP